MSSTTRRHVAAALLAATGVLHLALSPEYLDEQAYLGVLFILGGLAAIVVAVRLWATEDALAWAAGALMAAGMAVGFVLSRTVGLPGFHESEWEASGFLSLVLEGGFVVLAAGAAAVRSALPTRA